MNAVTIAVAAVVGLAAYTAGRVAKSRETDQRHAEELTRNWRHGQSFGRRQSVGYDEGFAEGWTSGRIALAEERTARSMHPTGSPESFLRVVDLEADERMKGMD